MLSLDLKQSSESAVNLLGQSVPVLYGPGEERHLSVLCPAGWEVFIMIILKQLSRQRAERKRITEITGIDGLGKVSFGDLI